MNGVANWKTGRLIEPRRIGFVSTRFAGTDGVSLESSKWADVLSADQHACFWYSGRSDRPSESSLCIPEANFGHPENDWISARIWNTTRRDPLVTRRIAELTAYLRYTLYQFVEKFEINLLIAQNALTIPMHIALGVAITEFVNETGLPVIAHHHDFHWERTRFSINAASDYLEMAFPPRHPLIHHVVINQAALEELSWRKGLPGLLIPNVLDFSTPPAPNDDYIADLRSEIGLAPDDVMILQPTRVVPRKGIEHAISLIQMLGQTKYKLIVSHEAGDEGFEYRNMLIEWAHNLGVDMRFIETRVGDIRQVNSQGQKMYTLADLYRCADLVTYPSLYEGFGNAFLEAVYYKVPIVTNRYAIFVRDIEPKGFHLPIMEGYVTKQVVREVRRILEDSDYRSKMVNHNYEIAKKFFDYAELRRKLRVLLGDIAGA